MQVSTILLTLALIGVVTVSWIQNDTIVKQTVTLRSMLDNPACLVGPVWQGKPKRHHGDMYVTPPEHRRYHVSNNALRGYDPRDEMRVLRGE